MRSGVVALIEILVQVFSGGLGYRDIRTALDTLS
jgi:hypothetical protein